MRGIVRKFNNKGLRTILLAFRDLPTDMDHLEKDEENVPMVEKQDLTLISIVAILDPVKEGVSDSVDLLKSASIKTYMVTGDSTTTAWYIGKESGIIDES
jgi:Ca2+-transporting ATPase